MRHLSIVIYSVVFLSTIFLYQNCGGSFEANNDLSAGTTGTELKIPNGYILIDDMIVKKSSMKRGEVNAQGIGVFDKYGKPWPKGRLFYKFDSSVTPEQRKIFLKNCEELGTFAAVSCVEGEGYDGGQHILVRTQITDEKWCGRATLGMEYPGQVYVMNSRCWKIPHVAAHELMHAFGVHHEQTRPDRDEYLTWDWEAVDRTGYSRTNFDMWENPSHTTNKYDYNSIMHYTSKLNGEIIFWKKGMAKSNFNSKIYWPNFPSLHDHRTLQLMYGGKWPTQAAYNEVYDKKQAFFDIRCGSGSKKRRLCFRASGEVKIVYMGGNNCGEPTRCESRNRSSSLPLCRFNKWGHDDGKSRIWVEKGCNARFRIWTKAKTTFVFDSHHYLPGRVLKTY